MKEDELRAYITSAKPGVGSDFMVLFPENPKHLERYYDIKTKAIYVFNGSDWEMDTPSPTIEIQADRLTDQIMTRYEASKSRITDDKVAKPKPSKGPARTPQGQALEESKRMDRELREYQAARAEMERRLAAQSPNDIMRQLTQEYNDLRIQQPWMTAEQAAEYIRKKYNP